MRGFPRRMGGRRTRLVAAAAVATSPQKTAGASSVVRFGQTGEQRKMTLPLVLRTAGTVVIVVDLSPLLFGQTILIFPVVDAIVFDAGFCWWYFGTATTTNGLGRFLATK